MPTMPISQAQFIANRFGGRRELASALGVNPKSVDYWCRESGFIPEEYRKRVLHAAQDLAVDVTPFDFIRHLVKLAD